MLLLAANDYWMEPNQLGVCHSFRTFNLPLLNDPFLLEAHVYTVNLRNKEPGFYLQIYTWHHMKKEVPVKGQVVELLTCPSKQLGHP